MGWSVTTKSFEESGAFPSRCQLMDVVHDKYQLFGQLGGEILGESGG
jgi:hypothetical protein